MATLTNAQLADLVRRRFPNVIVQQTGMSNWVTAYAVARAESGGRTDNIGGLGEVGIWQIYVAGNPRFATWNLYDADVNAEAAVILSNNGAGWDNWCTWERTACGGRGERTYLAYLDEAYAALQLAPARPPPPLVAALEMSLAVGVSVRVGQVVGLPIAVGNVGNTTAAGIVFAAAIDTSLLRALAWEPTPFYSVNGQLMSVLLPDLAPGQQWSGAVLIRGLAPAAVGIIGKATAANAPAAIGGTTVQVVAAPSAPKPPPPAAPALPPPAVAPVSSLAFVLAMGAIVGLGYYSWRIEHPRVGGKGARVAAPARPAAAGAAK